MMLYPCFYILLTLPLSVGRMWSMAHHQQTGIIFSCIAGSLMTSCGWVDCLLYTLTRRRLLQDTMPYGSGLGSTGHTTPTRRSDSVAVTRTTEFRVEAATPQGPRRLAPAHQRNLSNGLQSMHSTHQTHSRHDSTDPILSTRTTDSRIKTRISGGQHRRSSSDEGEDKEYELQTWEKFLHETEQGHPQQ